MSTSRSVRPEYAVRIRPRRCSAGTRPSVTSTMNRRLVRWNGVLIRKPSPPIASMALPMRSATVSGEPTKSTSDPGAPKRSIASWRNVLPLPHWANLSSEPCSPLVVSRGNGWSRSYLEKSMSVTVAVLASARSMKCGEDTIRWRFASRLFVGLGQASDRPGTAP